MPRRIATRQDPSLLPEAASGPTITALRPVGAEGRLISVVAAGRVAGRVSPETAEMLGLRVGAPWTDSIALEVDAESRAEAAHEHALRRLARRARSETELREWLSARRHDSVAIDAALLRLRRSGLLNDAALAGQVARATREQGPAGAALIERRLRERGLDPARALDDPDGSAACAADRDYSVGETAGAMALARREAARLRQPINPAKAARRMLGVLARRGFDDATATEAVRSALAERGITIPASHEYDGSA